MKDRIVLQFRGGSIKYYLSSNSPNAKVFKRKNKETNDLELLSEGVDLDLIAKTSADYLASDCINGILSFMSGRSRLTGDDKIKYDYKILSTKIISSGNGEFRFLNKLKSTISSKYSNTMLVPNFDLKLTTNSVMKQLVETGLEAIPGYCGSTRIEDLMKFLENFELINTDCVEEYIESILNHSISSLNKAGLDPLKELKILKLISEKPKSELTRISRGGVELYSFYVKNLDKFKKKNEKTGEVSIAKIPELLSNHRDLIGAANIKVFASTERGTNKDEICGAKKLRFFSIDMNIELEVPVETSEKIMRNQFLARYGKGGSIKASYAQDL